MAQEHYVAYVGTYTRGTSRGIHIYDADLAEGTLFLRKVVPVNNSSYLTIARNGRYLYSIADEGVQEFEITEDGDLIPRTKLDIDGMRGCHLSTDLTGRYLFVAGYHDGKVTVIRLTEDGRLDRVTDGVFHRGSGALNERSFRPHVWCVRVTPDNKYLLAVDSGTDQIVIYAFNETTGKIRQVDILRMGMAAGPHAVHFSRDGKVAYVLCELTCKVRVYAYDGSGKLPRFDLIQEIETISDEKDPYDTACALKVSADGSHVITSTAEDNSVALFSVDPETDTLTQEFALPIAGDYPKDIAFFPDHQHLAAVNNRSNSITTFRIDYEKSAIIMKGKPKNPDSPNCITFYKTKRAPEVIRDVPEEEAEEAAALLSKG